jgi:uncharacterized protein (DUF1800 family)
MKQKSRSLVLAIIVAMLLTPLHTFAQTPQQTEPRPLPQQPFTLEPIIKRLRDNLALNEAQTNQAREIFAKHEEQIKELRVRAQTQPYSQKLQTDLQKEQNEIREEITAILSEEQRVKVPQINVQLPVPVPPPFVLINVPPRNHAFNQTNANGLASAEPFIATTFLSSAKNRLPQLTAEQKILHLLNRVTFGLRPGDFQSVKQTGMDKFLEAQLHPEMIDNSEVEKRLAVLPTLQMTEQELYQFYPPPPIVDQRASEKNPQPVFGRPQQIYGELVQQKLVRAVSSNRQLQEMMTDFWFNHFNVFAQKDAVQWMVTSYERDVLRPNALGKFRDLLTAVAESPAMMFYLDNWMSASPDAKQPRPPRPQNAPPNPPQRPPNPPQPQDAKQAPVANLAPSPNSQNEAMKANDKAAMAEKSIPQAEKRSAQAMTNPQASNNLPPPQQQGRKPGINENYARELMELHTLGVDGGYTQKDVQEVARSFTGWTIDRPYQGGGFVFRPWMHDTGSKTVLGVTIPAGGGISDGKRVIELLSRHPSTARFISKKLCQRFVSDNPPPQLVERVAQIFLKTDGDIAEVLRAILTSAEFNSPTNFRSKVKSPLELVASAIRAVDGDTSGTPQLNDWLRKMGEPLYQQQAPTGYKENSAEWLNAGVFLNRINFGVALANNQIAATSYEPSRLVSGEATNQADLLIKQLTALIAHTELSGDSQQAVRAALQNNAPPMPQPRPVAAETNRPMPSNLQSKPETAANRRVAQIIGVLLGTAEFQRK